MSLQIPPSDPFTIERGSLLFTHPHVNTGDLPAPPTPDALDHSAGTGSSHDRAEKTVPFLNTAT